MEEEAVLKPDLCAISVVEAAPPNSDQLLDSAITSGHAASVFDVSAILGLCLGVKSWPLHVSDSQLHHELKFVYDLTVPLPTLFK